MAISIDWPSQVISVPKTFLSGGPSIYTLDIEQFRLALKDLEDNEQGISYPDTHRRNAPTTLAGVTFAQTFEIINGYTITFEDGTYRVVLSGANNNIPDVTNVNSVGLQLGNSAGLIVSSGGSNGSVWDEPLAGHTTPGTAGKVLSDAEANTDVTQAKVNSL